ncbi:MAG: Ribonuclease [Candidatus Saccharibacteria bacterium]|nr:Ribonuclease [Candidatus Saccharibacteria bacterium]
MKILKLDHNLAQLVAAGKKHSTWRIFDDKDLRVGDEVELVDKVDPDDKTTWKIIGIGVINRVVEARVGDITDSEALGATGPELLSTFQKHYGPEVNVQTAVKIITFDFTPLQGGGAVFEHSVEPSPTKEQLHELKLYGDGGSRGNPGPSASGFILLDMQDKVLLDEGIYLGITTNNQAEYLSLKYGLEEALKRGARIVHVHMDSLLVVNQMKGIFKVKNRDLWAVHQTIKDILPKFEKVTFTHVPREFNKLADAAVNRTLDVELGITR